MRRGVSGYLAHKVLMLQLSYTVLTKGRLDDGRGRARVSLFRHKHEIDSGTSCFQVVAGRQLKALGRQVAPPRSAWSFSDSVPRASWSSPSRTSHRPATRTRTRQRRREARRGSSSSAGRRSRQRVRRLCRSPISRATSGTSQVSSCTRRFLMRDTRQVPQDDSFRTHRYLARLCATRGGW